MLNQDPKRTINWSFLEFTDLSAQDLHDIFQVRQQVFIIEQQCFYDDIDGLDPVAVHVLGTSRPTNGKPQIEAYLRFFEPGIKGSHVSLGRVLIHPRSRKTGLGKMLMQQAIESITSRYSNAPISISAQKHLTNFYSDLGFHITSRTYVEDGIPHIDMLRQPIG